MLHLEELHPEVLHLEELHPEVLHLEELHPEVLHHHLLMQIHCRQLNCHLNRIDVCVGCRADRLEVRFTTIATLELGILLTVFLCLPCLLPKT